jgi:hypothetical protein
MRPSVLQREMNRGLSRFYRHKLLEDLKQGNFHELYYKLSHFPLFLSMNKYWREHVRYLEEVERDLYDENDHLIEEKLGEGIFPHDVVKPWLPEVQAKVVHPVSMVIPTGQIRVPAGYGKNGALEIAPLNVEVNAG